MKRTFLKTVVAALTLAACGGAFAQERTIKFANQNTAGHPIVQGMENSKNWWKPNQAAR